MTHPRARALGLSAALRGALVLAALWAVLLAPGTRPVLAEGGAGLAPRFGVPALPRRIHLSDPLSRLRLAGAVEGATLLILLLVAVPLKHLAGVPAAVSVMGPVHGVAFVAYLVALADNFAGGGWRPREMARVGLVALVPLGTFLNDPWLARRQAAQP